jgi:hypothetical protein
MPSKGKKTAARQASLRDNKKRGKGTSHQFQAAPATRQLDEEDGTPVVASTSSASSTSDTPQAKRTPRLSRRARQAAVEEVGTYQHMGAEIRHIGIVASGIFVIIIGLSFVLG